jgi:hypothetical protein
VTLPNGERAFIDGRKLVEYALDPVHDEGRHKAHVFESLLGINLENADFLLNALRQAARTNEAVAGSLDQYGQRYVIDFDFSGPERSATIRLVWIVRHDEDFPRLVTCFIL